ncbi:hypothetical protein JL720_16450 [Aureococcus anophagefferens]|nr:hypothetical protein JL720_16450 [Aureococcus anophagefferens]
MRRRWRAGGALASRTLAVAVSPAKSQASSEGAAAVALPGRARRVVEALAGHGRRGVGSATRAAGARTSPRPGPRRGGERGAQGLQGLRDGAHRRARDREGRRGRGAAAELEDLKARTESGRRLRDGRRAQGPRALERERACRAAREADAAAAAAAREASLRSASRDQAAGFQALEAGG